MTGSGLTRETSAQGDPLHGSGQAKIDPKRQPLTRARERRSRPERGEESVSSGGMSDAGVMSIIEGRATATDDFDYTPRETPDTLPEPHASRAIGSAELERRSQLAVDASSVLLRPTT